MASGCSPNSAWMRSKSSSVGSITSTHTRHPCSTSRSEIAAWSVTLRRSPSGGNTVALSTTALLPAGGAPCGTRPPGSQWMPRMMMATINESAPTRSIDDVSSGTP